MNLFKLQAARLKDVISHAILNRKGAAAQAGLREALTEADVDTHCGQFGKRKIASRIETSRHELTASPIQIRWSSRRSP